MSEWRVSVAKVVGTKGGRIIVACPHCAHTHVHERASLGSQLVLAGCHKGLPLPTRLLNPRPEDKAMTLIPGVSSLHGCLVRALETEAGERGYLIRLGLPDGSSVNLLASVGELDNLRQQIETATVSGMLGDR